MFDELPAWVTSYLPLAPSGTLPKLACNTGPSFSSNDVFSVLGEWHQLPVTVTALRIRWAPTRGWETTRAEIEKYDLAVGEFWLGKLRSLRFSGNGRWKGTRFGWCKNDSEIISGRNSSRWTFLNGGMEIICSISPIQTFVREEPCTLESQDGSGCHAIAGCCSRSHCETLPGRNDVCVRNMPNSDRKSVV